MVFKHSSSPSIAIYSHCHSRLLPLNCISLFNVTESCAFMLYCFMIYGFIFRSALCSMNLEWTLCEKVQKCCQKVKLCGLTFNTWIYCALLMLPADWQGDTAPPSIDYDKRCIKDQLLYNLLIAKIVQSQRVKGRFVMVMLWLQNLSVQIALCLNVSFECAENAFRFYWMKWYINFFYVLASQTPKC